MYLILPVAAAQLLGAASVWAILAAGFGVLLLVLCFVEAGSLFDRAGGRDRLQEARQAVRLQVKFGADVIKMCVSGGVLSLGDEVSVPQMTDEEIAAAVDEAHRLGKKTAAHAHGDLAARAAVKAGIDSIEHGSFMADETLALMKSKGTYLVPTLLVGEWVTRPEAKFLPTSPSRRRPRCPSAPTCSDARRRSASRSPSAPTPRFPTASRRANSPS